MPHSLSPIGVFDSGVGGLTVLRQLIDLLPEERFVYFGDTARLPYGEKSRETIIRYSIENTIFLLEKNIKLLVVACNTATAHALERLEQIFNIPVIGVIEPCVEQAIEVSKKGRIAILGTKGTIRSESYQKAILQKMPTAYVLPVACPLFVPLVEEQYMHHAAARLIVQEHLKPIREKSIDTLLLGCTHYPLLKDLIRSEVGDEVNIVDSSSACAHKVCVTLKKMGLQATENATPKIEYFVSDDPLKFQMSGRFFLKLPIEHVSLYQT